MQAYIYIYIYLYRSIYIYTSITYDNGEDLGPGAEVYPDVRFNDWGFESRIQGPRVEGLGFQRPGFRGLRFRIQGSGCRVHGLWLGVQGLWLKVEWWWKAPHAG